MPGITMIGENRRVNYVPSALPAEPRALSRMLNLLQSPKIASEALLDSLAQGPSSRQRNEIILTLEASLALLQDLDLPAKEIVRRMSIAADVAIQFAFADAPTNNNIRPNKDHNASDGSGDDDISSASPLPMRTQESPSRAAALVSDSSTAGVLSDTDEDASVEELDNDLSPVKRFWGILLECIHLQVASRTTTVWGKQKIYEVYQLSGLLSWTDSASEIAKAIETEFLTVFYGARTAQSECRAYVIAGEKSLYIQMSIGKLYDFQDERNRSIGGEKKKKRENEFVAIIEEGSGLVALTASRAPSRSRYTKFVLTALDAVLTQNRTPATIATDELIPKRVGHLSGTEPIELLEAAHAAQGRQAFGRFAWYAAEKIGDPLTELHTAATASLVDRCLEKKRLEVGAQYNRSVAQICNNVAPAAVVAAGDGGMLVDHSAANKKKRKRARKEDLGRTGDLPKLQRLCWTWTGETSAVTASKLMDREWMEDLPKTKFKCGVVMQGTNIFKGLQAMMDAGLADAPLPDFVRDAPTLGTATIRVENGKIAGSDSFAAV